MNPTLATSEACKRTVDQAFEVAEEHRGNTHLSMVQHLDSMALFHDQSCLVHMDSANGRCLAGNALEEIHQARFQVQFQAHFRAVIDQSSPRPLRHSRQPLASPMAVACLAHPVENNLARTVMHPKTECSVPIVDKALRKGDKGIAKLHTAELGFPIPRRCACCQRTSPLAANFGNYDSRCVDNQNGPARPVQFLLRIAEHAARLGRG